MAVVQALWVVIMRWPLGAVMHSLSLQDHILPYCCDPRHPADTWFIIAEEDFRLCEKDDRNFKSVLLNNLMDDMAPDLVETAHVGIEGEEIFVEPDVLYAKRRSLREGAEDEPVAFLSEAGSQFKHLVNGMFTRAQPNNAKGERDPPEELKDLVKMGIAAHRANIGNFLWYSWEGALGKGCRTKPCHGTTLVGISVKGAHMLLDAINSGEIAMQHADVGFRHHLEKHWDDFGCSYMYPSVGHYAVHKSGCETGLDVRESNWNLPWVQEGTRMPRPSLGGTQKSAAPRFLMRFRQKGMELQWVRKVALPEGPDDEKLYWKSFRRENPSLDPEDPTAPLTSPRTVSEKGEMTRREKRSRRHEKVLDGMREWVPREDQAR